MPDRRRLVNPTVRISSSLHDADGLSLNEDGEVQGWKDLSRHVGSVTIKQEYSEAERDSLNDTGISVVAGGTAEEMEQLKRSVLALPDDHDRRVDALTSLAKMETRLVWIGDHILSIARRVRHPFAS